MPRQLENSNATPKLRVSIDYRPSHIVVAATLCRDNFKTATQHLNFAFLLIIVHLTLS
ncbi:hypothetical protein [Pseudoalteromonas piscicida]